MEKERKGLTILSFVFFVLGVYFIQWLATYLIDYANTFYNELFFFPGTTLKIKMISLCLLFLCLAGIVVFTTIVINKRIDNYGPSLLDICAGLYLAIRSGIVLDWIIMDLDEDMSMIYYIYNIGLELLVLLGGLAIIVYGVMRFRKYIIGNNIDTRISVIVIYFFFIIGAITLVLIPILYILEEMEYWLALIMEIGACGLVIACILLRIVLLLKNMSHSNVISNA